MADYVNAAEIFGENVFNDAVMQERLPKKVYAKLKKIINDKQLQKWAVPMKQRKL